MCLAPVLECRREDNLRRKPQSAPCICRDVSRPKCDTSVSAKSGTALCQRAIVGCVSVARLGDTATFLGHNQSDAVGTIIRNAPRRRAVVAVIPVRTSRNEPVLLAGKPRGGGPRLGGGGWISD